MELFKLGQKFMYLLLISLLFLFYTITLYMLVLIRLHKDVPIEYGNNVSNNCTIA